MRVRISLILLLGCSPLFAAPVVDLALGSQLAGGVVTVTRFGGVLSSATFVPAGTGASAIALGSGGFTLSVSPGDTALATWTLTNTDPSLIFLNSITAVTIDLTLSGISLFDSGAGPSTPDSGPGIPGVIHAGGTGISGATDLLPWSDSANLGDMYHAVSIAFSAGLSSGGTSSWMDDTDVTTAVPDAGSTLLLLALAVGVLPMLRRGWSALLIAPHADT